VRKQLSEANEITDSKKAFLNNIVSGPLPDNWGSDGVEQERAMG